MIFMSLVSENYQKMSIITEAETSFIFSLTASCHSLMISLLADRLLSSWCNCQYSQQGVNSNRGSHCFRQASSHNKLLGILHYVLNVLHH